MASRPGVLRRRNGKDLQVGVSVAAGVGVGFAAAAALGYAFSLKGR